MPYASTVIATGGNVKDRSPDSSPNVTVVPPLYQLVLVAATEGSIFHVIVTAADCNGRTTVTCAGNTTQTQSTHISVLLLFVLHQLLVTRLYD